jgi:hypothetical protein
MKKLTNPMLVPPELKGDNGKADWQELAAMSDADLRFSEDSPRTEPEDWIGAISHRGLPVSSVHIIAKGRK